MFEAVVTSATRRYVDLCREAGANEIVQGKLSSAAMEVVVGDRVKCREAGTEIVVDTILTRKNQLQRAYGEKTKILAANVDLLCVITAPIPLFNAVFIDRILSAATVAGIRTCLIANKKDLANQFAETQSALETYRALNLPVIEISAKHGDGLEHVEELLNAPNVNAVVFAGVSGVGKTTLLRALLPELSLKTQAVSERTGQGKQTTSLSVGYVRQKGANSQYLIDLPGIQNYGITHLSKAEVRGSFSEFLKSAEQCRFANCEHKKEPSCGVREAVAEKRISQSRFDSYLNMLDEIERARKY